MGTDNVQGMRLGVGESGRGEGEGKTSFIIIKEIVYKRDESRGRSELFMR